MSHIFNYIKTRYNYSEYQILLLRYCLNTLISEISKFIILSFWFIYISKYVEFLYGLLILSILRLSNGGLHFKRYFSCFLATFTIMNLSIILLPMLNIKLYIELLLLTLCLLVNYFLLKPAVSQFRVPPNEKLIQRGKKLVTIIIFLHIITIYLFTNPKLLYIGCWNIVIHTIQLIIANILTKSN